MSPILQHAKQIIEIQKQGIEDMLPFLNENLENAVNLIANCKGHVILAGVGKSGNIAVKISATMSSIGIPSFFIDPSNAGHGDMGGINKNSILIVISNSGEALEIMEMLNFCKQNTIPTIAITRNAKSSIANGASISLTLPASPEAHAFNAPTTSTTQTLILGDVLALCASQLKGFTKEQYAKLHPSGNLGMKISKATTIMQQNIETVELNASSQEVLQKMTKHSNGFVCVTKETKLYGIITDGDLRRFLLSGGEIKTTTAQNLCKTNPQTIKEDDYIIDAITTITTNNIRTVVVINTQNQPTGFISASQFKI